MATCILIARCPASAWPNSRELPASAPPRAAALPTKLARCTDVFKYLEKQSDDIFISCRGCFVRDSCLRLHIRPTILDPTHRHSRRQSSHHHSRRNQQRRGGNRKRQDHC